MIECSRDCIKVLDLEGRLLSMNAGGMEALEICDIGPLHGLLVDRLLEGRRTARLRAQLSRPPATEAWATSSGYFETVQTRQPRWFDVVVNPDPRVGRPPESLLAVSRDVTERKRSEDLFRRMTQATATATGSDFFHALVETLAGALRSVMPS